MQPTTSAYFFNVITMLSYIIYLITEYVLYIFSPVSSALSTLRFPMSQTKQPQYKLPEGLRVLNTITKLLACIPRYRDMESRDNLDKKQWETPGIREELKLLDAFAQLIVSTHEVAAIASNRSKDLNLVASVIEDTDEATEETNEDTGTLAKQCWETIKGGVYRLIGTINSRPKDEGTSSGKLGPILISPERPSDLGERTATEYMIDLEKNWCVLCNNYVIKC